MPPVKKLVELFLLDKLNGSGQPFSDFILLMLVDIRRQTYFFGLSIGSDRIAIAKFWRAIIPGDKLSGNMTTANAHHVKERRVTGFRELKAFFNHVYYAGEIRPRIQ